MPKRTLIDMVQNIMSSMDSDTVNSITDTTESSAIADIVETTYYDLITNRVIPEHREIFELTALGDSTRPAMMEVPSTVETIEWLKYDRRQSSTDTRLRFETILYKTTDAMLDLLNSRDSTDSTTVVNMPSKNTTSVDLLVKNNVNPTYWTMFDDRYIVFDSYDSAIDSTLQQSKTQCYGLKEPSWTKSDSFVPDLDLDLFPLLLSASKSVSFATLKSANNPAVNAAARAHIIRTQGAKHKSTIMDDIERLTPSFGRRSTFGETRSNRSRRSQ